MSVRQTWRTSSNCLDSQTSLSLGGVSHSRTFCNSEKFPRCALVIRRLFFGLLHNLLILTLLSRLTRLNKFRPHVDVLFAAGARSCGLSLESVQALRLFR